MKNHLLQLAGAGAIVVALIHGVLLETTVFRRATIAPAWARTLIHALSQSTTASWISSGALLIATSFAADSSLRPWIVGATCVPCALGAIANAVASRGRHFGWIAMTAVIAAAVAGA